MLECYIEDLEKELNEAKIKEKNEEYYNLILNYAKSCDCYVHLAPREIFFWLEFKLHPLKRFSLGDTGWSLLKCNFGYDKDTVLFIEI